MHNLVQLPTADIGSFLEGAFAPLAFLWLVIGHFMQQREIASPTKAIGIQEQSATTKASIRWWGFPSLSR